jgi:uncharacterized protein YciI
MAILLVEYHVDDFDAWKAVFDADPIDRGSHGVTRHWIHRDPDDRNHHMLGMEFATHEEARVFREVLAPMWEMSGAAQAWVLEAADGGEPPARAPAKVSRFVYRLIPPRPTFPADMTEAEAAIMAEHFAYWKPFEQRGQVVVLGPVVDPAGTWGLGVIEGETEDEVRAIVLADPAVASGMATFELLAMADPFVRSSSPTRFRLRESSAPASSAAGDAGGAA